MRRSWFLLWLGIVLVAGCQRSCVCESFSCRPGNGPKPVPPRPDASVARPAPPAPPRTTIALARNEVCTNGVDDDLDGRVDEGCGCMPGDTQPCYTGLPDTAGVGLCARGRQACSADSAGFGVWSACVGAIAPSEEICNGFDDDCDGALDEVCDCTLAATAPCFGGAQAQLGVGVCEQGVLACSQEYGGLDGTTYEGFGVCEGQVLGTREVCNGRDDDCNGATDDIPEVCNGVDDDCDAEVDEGACVPIRYDGAPLYYTRYWGLGGGGLLEATAPLYRVVELASATVCAPDELALETAPEEFRCVPAMPQTCRAGTRPMWSPGGWTCVECAVLVQFGYLFDGERTCAPEPSVTCPPGQVPTFDEATRRWTCAPECDNGEYDRAYRGSTLVCVPC